MCIRDRPPSPLPPLFPPPSPPPCPGFMCPKNTYSNTNCNRFPNSEYCNACPTACPIGSYNFNCDINNLNNCYECKPKAISNGLCPRYCEIFDMISYYPEVEYYGQGYCPSEISERTDNIYGSNQAWRLLNSEEGRMDLNNVLFGDMVKAAASLCRKKFQETTYVSVFNDGGYRCYSSTDCNINMYPSSATYKVLNNMKSIDKCSFYQCSECEMFQDCKYNVVTQGGYDKEGCEYGCKSGY